MKPCTIALLLLLLPLALSAQEAVKPDPLVGHYVFGNSAEIVHFTQTTTPQLSLRHALHDLRPEGTVVGPTWNTMTDSLDLSAGRFLDYAAGDINADGKDELIIARAGSNDSLVVTVCSPTKVADYWFEWSTPPVSTYPGARVTGPIRLLTANLDQTPEDEVIVTSIDSSRLSFFVFDSLDAGTGRLIGKERASANASRIVAYDIDAGDFNSDGMDEIIYVPHWDDTTHNYIVVCVMKYEPSTPNDWSSVVASPMTTLTVPWSLRTRFKVTAGDFRNVGHDEAVLSATEISGNNGRQVYSLLRIDPDAHTVTVKTPLLAAYPAGAAWGVGYESNAVGADLNPLKKDGDELVVAGPGEVAVLKFNANYDPYYLTKTPFGQSGFLEPYQRRRFLCVEDINADTLAASWAPEIVVAEHAITDTMHGTTLFRVLETTRSAKDSITGLRQLFYASPGNLHSTTPGIVMGDFDGDAIRAGVPKYIAKNAFLQPIVALNVPPTHFDSLNGQVYDVCEAYPTSGSPFKVKYTQTQSQTSHFSTELGQSWGVSGQVGASGTVYGAKIKASVAAAYGQGTYGTKTFDTTTTVSEELTASADDWALATVADYDIWEYPLYVNGNHHGDALVQIPHFTTTKWLPSKDLLILDQLADHEVGNLLSYPTSMSYQAMAGSDLLTSFSTMTVANGAQMQWLLDLSTASVADSQFTRKLGVDVSASISGWGMEAKVNGEYDRKDITTHTSSATKYVTITADVGPPDAAIPNASYTVKPFIYWGKNGALTVDYAVDLDPGPVGLESFWGRTYGAHPDPAFILPWRLDVEKGLGLNPQLKLYSKSLRVSPSTPAPGDNVAITARVHNFSLKDTDGPVKVRFYLGRPDSGGVPIVGTGGVMDVSTGAAIPARQYKTVGMNWTAPSGLGSSARVYAVIDPNNEVTEIHEDNNVGYVMVRQAGTTGVEEQDHVPSPQSFALQQNYPNPFNPATVIVYDLPERSHVTLTVFDLLGRNVATLVDDDKGAGHHHVVFDAQHLATGMYLYRLQTGDRSLTRKMVVVK
jgi:hypothetical protein